MDRFFVPKVDRLSIKEEKVGQAVNVFDEEIEFGMKGEILCLEMKCHSKLYAISSLKRLLQQPFKPHQTA